MEIKFSEIMELSRKAALFDGIISYVKSNNYVSRDEILAFAGEVDAFSNEDSEDGDGDV